MLSAQKSDPDSPPCFGLALDSLEDLRKLISSSYGSVEAEEQLFCNLAHTLSQPIEGSRAAEVASSVLLLLAWPEMPIPLILRQAAFLNSLIDESATSSDGSTNGLDHNVTFDSVLRRLCVDREFILMSAGNLQRALVGIMDVVVGHALRKDDAKIDDPEVLVHPGKRQSVHEAFECFYDKNSGAWFVLAIQKALRRALFENESIAAASYRGPQMQNRSRDNGSVFLISHRLVEDKRFVRLDYERFKSIGENAFESSSGRRDRPSWSIVGEFPFVLGPRVKAEYVQVEGAIGMQLGVQDAFFRAMFEGPQSTVLALSIRRENLLGDARRQIAALPPHLLRQRLRITFVGEPGVDQGGLVREFFQLAVRAIFSKGTASNDPDSDDISSSDAGVGSPFRYNPDSRVYWFTPSTAQSSPLCENGGKNQEWPCFEEEYRFTGVLVGLAIYNGVLLEAPLPTFLFKLILALGSGRCEPESSLDDLAQIDPFLAAGLKSMLSESYDTNSTVVHSSFESRFSDTVSSSSLSNSEVISAPDQPITRKENAALDSDDIHQYSYSMDVQCADNVIRTVDLVPNGSKVHVGHSFEERERYVNSYSRMLLWTLVERQVLAFLEGISSVIGTPRGPKPDIDSLDANEKSVIYQFEASEIEQIACGRPMDKDSVSIWQSCARYEGGYRPDTPVVHWFWQWCIGKSIDDESPGSSEEERMCLLAFVTGSRRVPIGGLGSLPITIMRTAFDERSGECEMAQLPTAHTCFNYLVLPEYPDSRMLVCKLRRALEHYEGFGLQ